MTSLGVSRATVRAAVGRLVDRGLLVRRQGSGTFLARLPEGSEQPSPVGVKLGTAVGQLGRPETYTSMADRLGVRTDTARVRVEVAAADRQEAAVLEVAEGTGVLRASRVLVVDGTNAAWMLDVLPADLVPAATVWTGLSRRTMLLDVLLDAGIPVGFSEVAVDAALLGQGEPAGAALALTGPVAALSLTETMYLDNAASSEGRPVQWSRNYFLPGTLSLSLIREMPASHDPAVVFQLLARC